MQTLAHKDPTHGRGGPWLLWGLDALGNCTWKKAGGRTKIILPCERLQAKQMCIKELNSSIGKDDRFLHVQ